MPLAKVIEVLAEGPTVEEALKNAVNQASKTVEGIRSIYIQESQGIVENNEIIKFRINAKITFLINEGGK